MSSHADLKKLTHPTLAVEFFPGEGWRITLNAPDYAWSDSPDEMWDYLQELKKRIKHAEGTLQRHKLRNKS